MGSAKIRKSKGSDGVFLRVIERRQPAETVADLIIGLDALIEQARESDLSMAARIFTTAKEEMIHWAVTMNFHETVQDRFINQQLCQSRFAVIGDLIARMRTIKDPATRQEVMNVFGLGALDAADLGAENKPKPAHSELLPPAGSA